MEVEELPADAPAPRLCHLVKWPDFDGYGFNLHAEKSKTGQFVGKVDETSPAQAAGLREGDRIIEVNGVNIANENHRQVVERIKANPRETKLLVIEESGDLWYKERALVIRGSQANVISLPSSADLSSSDNIINNNNDSKVVDEMDSVPREEEKNVESGESDAAAVEVSPGKSGMSVMSQDCVRNESSTQIAESAVSSSPSSPTAPFLPTASAESKTLIVDSEKSEEGLEEPKKEEKIESKSVSEALGSEIVSHKSPDAVFVTLTTKGKTSTATAATNVICSSSNSSNSNNNNNSKSLPSPEVEAASGSKKFASENNADHDKDMSEEVSSVEIAAPIRMVKSIGVNGNSPPVTGSHSPTSFKSQSSSSESTNNNDLPSLGSGGEGSLEMTLNMSVSQMRQVLAQKKRVDPKKVAMDLKQKYEIISSM